MSTLNTMNVTGHSPWGFSGPILQIFLLGDVRSDVSLYNAPQAAAISAFFISPDP